MTTKPEPGRADDVLLETLFQAARDHAPQPSDALMARVLADAAAARAAVAPVPTKAPRPVVRPGFWALLNAALGGGRGVAGLAAAGLAGVWIGFAQPLDLSLGLGFGPGSAQSVTVYPGDLDLWSDVLAIEPVPEG